MEDFTRIIKMRHPVLLMSAITIIVNSVHSQLLSSSDQRRGYQLSPQQQGLKPAGILEELPPPDLIEPAPRMDDPRLAEMNLTALRLKIGSNFDPTFMSITMPSERDSSVSNFSFRRNRLGRLIPTGNMPDYLTKVDFKYVTLMNGSKLRTRITPKLKRKIQQFLWSYTACPVLYKWKDLGIRFWPRFLKEGHCPQDISCSIPPGMTCRPSASTHKTILRWHCKNYLHNQNIYATISSSSTHQKHCQWIKVEYPILTECSCSCSPSISRY